MGFGSNATQRVARYYLSTFWGICAASDGIELLEVKVGDKIFWRGGLTQNASVGSDKMDLHGGDTKEGGASGVIHWLNGNQNQILSPFLASKFGKTPTTMPGYRGLASIFLTGPEGDGYRGFYVGANNPYIKKIAARVRRAPVGLDPTKAMIRLKDHSEGYQQFAANAVHIIYECMTNSDWGMGESASMIDVASFNTAANTVFNEKLGLNLLWTRQSSIEDFINIVLGHIQGAMFINPTTGKHTIKLLRADYNINDLKIVNPSNAKLSGFKTKTWAEVSNEVVVTWTHPETGKEETVTVQDLAAIASKGGITSASRNYHGIADQDTAIMVAERDLSAIAYPLSSCKAEVTREFFAAVNNGCVVLNWPDYGVQSSVYRITEVTRGSTSRTITLTLMEDVFSLQHAHYIGADEREWFDPAVLPQPLTNIHMGTLPAFMTTNRLRLNSILDLPDAEALPSIMAMRQTTDDIAYDLHGYKTDVNGDVDVASMGDRIFASGFTLQAPLVQEAASTVDASNMIGGLPARGTFLQIGQGADAATEIATITAVNGSTLTIARGMLDTTPKDWPVETRVMAYIKPSYTADATRRADGEVASYHFLPYTSRGKLALADAPRRDVTISDRPHLPNRPADVKVGETAFGTVGLNGATSVTVTWANRNRVTEATQAMRWSAAGMNPESGQTTLIKLLSSADRSILRTVAGLAGESTTLDLSEFGSSLDAIVKVMAERDGYESLQGHEIKVVYETSGGEPPPFDYYWDMRNAILTQGGDAYTWYADRVPNSGITGSTFDLVARDGFGRPLTQPDSDSITVGPQWADGVTVDRQMQFVNPLNLVGLHILVYIFPWDHPSHAPQILFSGDFGGPTLEVSRTVLRIADDSSILGSVTLPSSNFARIHEIRWDGQNLHVYLDGVLQASTSTVPTSEFFVKWTGGPLYESRNYDGMFSNMIAVNIDPSKSSTDLEPDVLRARQTLFDEFGY